jgi:adenosine deaminase
MSIQPLARVPISPAIASLPKADLHLHQEEVARLERVVARSRGRLPYDWKPRAEQLIAATPPGVGRINAIYAPDAGLALEGVPADDPEYIVAKIADVLEESAADGAILVEVNFGAVGLALMRPDFMDLFREAERRVQVQHPSLFAEAIALLHLAPDPGRSSSAQHQFEACLRMAREGLAGIDMIVVPYDTEADPATWAAAYRWAERAADAGLGISVHAGEFSTANLAAALHVPGLQRVGHAVYAAADPRLLETLARSGVTVECPLSCNVVLGAVPSYEAHPIRQFVSLGIPVTLSTDLPVHSWTTIGREYAMAEALGFSLRDLAAFTSHAVEASFTSATRRNILRQELRRREASAASGSDTNLAEKHI